MPESSEATGEILPIRSAKCGMKPTNKSTPATLNRIFAMAACIASRGLRIGEIHAVRQVPMLEPKIRAIPVSRLISPLLATTITMPVVADELYTSAVNTPPTSTPESGFRISCIMAMKGS